MSDMDDDVTLEEPTDDQPQDSRENHWMRGLWMIVLAILFGVGEFILVVAAVLQFLWILIGKEKNTYIAEFGRDLSDWLGRVALFQTGASDDKPFPFDRWGIPD
ncbi:MAG: DUF4389 domain-containing protein [Maritimibacter sp.]